MSKTVATLPELTNVNVIGLNSAGVVESRPLRGGETVVTNFIVEDTGTVSSSSSKTLQTLVSREFFLRDTVPPVYFDYSAANLLQGPPPSHAVRPGGTSAVQDDQAQGALLVRHVLTFGQPTDEQLDALFADPVATAGASTGLGAFGSHVVPAFQFVPNAPLLLSRYPSLATSKVVRFSGPDAWTVELVADSERKTIVSTVVAQDASGNKSRAETSYVVLDTTAPAVGTVSVSEVTDVSARVSAQATDSGDANAGVARTATYAGLFETASISLDTPPAFDPSTGLFAGAIENKVFGESGSVVFGASGSQPLDDFTEYTVFVCAVDSCPAKNASDFRTATFKTLDGTPPVGLDLVSLAAASVTATSVAVEGLDLVTDAGDGVQSLSLFYGPTADFASAVQAAGSPFSPGSPSAPTATFVVGGLDDATLYHFWVSATDGRNPAGPVPVGTARTLDATDPVISSFDATQTAGGYSFSASSGTLVDNADGPMKAYLVMCSAPHTTEQLEAILVTGGSTMQSSAKNESFAYSFASGAAQVSSANLTASEYWTGAEWAAISETAPSAPHQLWAHLLVLDAAGNAGSAQNLGAIKTVADREAPTLTSFGATQSPAGYSFSLDASTRVADTRAGPLKTYFFLATAAIGDAKAFVATHASNAAVAKNEAVAYSPSSVAVAPPALTASKFWNGSAWTDVVEATTTLNALFVVLDAAGLGASSTVAKTVTDVTAPAFSGTVALTAEGETSVKAAWSAGIADGRGVTEGRVYYSTTAPASTTAAGIAAWKAAATTYFAAVSPLSSLGAAGSATVTGLTAGTTYHVYLCAKDAAGNELNVATVPASVSTSSVSMVSPVSDTPVQTYANRYVEFPDFDALTSPVSSVYGATDTAAMQSVFTSSPAKTVIAWYDKPGRTGNEANYNGWSSAAGSVVFQGNAQRHLIINAGQTAHLAKPPLFTESDDWINMFIAITQSADGTIKTYHNITGDPNSGPPLTKDPQFTATVTKCIGALVQQSVIDTGPVVSRVLDFTNFGNGNFIRKDMAHWKDLIVVPEALSLSQIQAFYDRPRHVVDMHGTSMTRLGNVISKSAASETRVGIPVYMHGKAYFEFDADNMSVLDNHLWGLAETTKLSLASYFGSEVSGTRALSVSMSTKVAYFVYKDISTTRPALTTDYATVRRTYCLAVDYTTGHAWWGIDGYFGGYNPVTRVAVSGRTAQADPALDSTTPNTTSPDFDIRRMRYAVIRLFGNSARLYLKSSYRYTPAGFTPFYTYASSQLYSPFSGGFPNTHQGVMNFFRANSAGFNNFANNQIGTYSWDAAKQMYLAGGLAGGNLQIYGVEHLRPPFKASMEFECTQTPRVVQVGAVGNPSGDLNAVNSFLNQINIVSQRSENRSTFTQKWIKSNNTNVQSGDYAGPIIPLNVKCRMTVTVFSTTSVEIRVERADGTAISNGVYANAAVSPAFSSTLDWRPYFQVESPGIYFGNFKFDAVF